MASALSKKGHKPWDVCECGHAWIDHTNDDGPCAHTGLVIFSSERCPCPGFTWRAVPEAIKELKSIMEELKPKENNDDPQL